jgi:hypothetical protein
MRATCRTFWIVAVTLLALMTTLAAMPPGASAQPGNSGAAHRCQQNGYLRYLDAGGVVFADTGACVRFAAQGGELPQYSAAELACMDEAIAYGIVPAGMNVTAGTDGNDAFGTGGGLICGFGGDDVVTSALTGIFLGGAGDDVVVRVSAGDFYGGDGYDVIQEFHSGYGPFDSTIVSVEAIPTAS